MEEKIKRKIEVTIAGITMSLVTDESESFVSSIVKRMDETMTALMGRNMKRSQLDAAMLCAIEFCGDKILAEKRVRNLEAQISLYDVNLRRLREENLALRKKLEGDSAESAPDNAKSGEPVIGEQIAIGDGAGEPSAPETADGAAANAPAEASAEPEASLDAEPTPSGDGETSADGGSRGDKLKMIEALLRK